MEVSNRNLGIDLLRIVSMFMVVILHVLGNGGIMWNVIPQSINYNLVWFLKIASYCAVNCYGLITGYVSVDSKFKYSRIIGLWLQVTFYTVTITLLFKVFTKDIVGTSQLIISMLPILTKQYWYFTAYFGLFFFIPFINKLISALTKRQLEKLIITLIILLSILPALSLLNIFSSEIDLFNTNGGYSVIWLISLYVIGAYFKKYEFSKKIKRSWYFIGYCLCVVLTFGGNSISEYLTLKLLGKSYFQNMFICYTSPFILFSGIFLLLYFSKCDIKGRLSKKIILTLAPASFGVYLIHTQALIWDYIICNRFISYVNLPPLQLLLYVIGTGVLIYIIASLIDLARIKLFLVLNVSKLVNFIESTFKKLIIKII